MNRKRKIPWKKNLYENIGYADNYTDSSIFLKDLRTNEDVKIYGFWEAALGTSRLSQQISCLIIFLSIFYLMFISIIIPQIILIQSSLITFLGYVLYIYKMCKCIDKNTNNTVHHSLIKSIFVRILNDSKSVLAVLVFGYILSPMLHSLTDSISTDTIFTITFICMLLHLVFFDYGVPGFIVSRTVSFNLALFGSICLASRLASSFHAFTFLVLAAEFFALLPLFLDIFRSSFWLLPMIVICCWFLLTISLTLFLSYLFLLIFINIICPYIFVKKQKYKNNINGPWDEAIVNELDIDSCIRLSTL